MPNNEPLSATLPRDLTSGLVVFLVALPLCLGIALASGAPLFAGVLAGIVGGILVGVVSGSHTSVSGPAAGLTAVVAAQIAALGSFEAFLAAVVLAGVIQIGFGLARLGFLTAFVPSSVIKGLLAAIGVVIILKQLPHLVGDDNDPEGDLGFQQIDQRNTFTELYELVDDPRPGPALIGLAAVALLVLWDRVRWLKKSPVPAALVVVLFGVAAAQLLAGSPGGWAIGPKQFVQVPVPATHADLWAGLPAPTVSRWADTAVLAAALTLALVASLETLLNLEAVDKLDPRKRNSPSNRELLAQGVGNVVSGLIGGLPVTSVIVRSSVNIDAGSRTKLSAVFHGVLLLVCVLFLPAYLNRIPLSCLAAILLVTGVKLASPKLVREMWKGGYLQFVPFAVTVVAIVRTDLLVGILIGLGISVAFILRSNVLRPLRRTVEKHLGGEVVRIELANQVSFLNRAALTQALDEVPRGGHVLLDARNTDYIDPDVLGLIREFKEQTAPAHGIEVSLVGFREQYHLRDQTQYVDYATRAIQSAATPADVLQILKDGHARFRSGQRLTRDLGRQVNATAAGQHPLAVVLSCIDSRTPVELLFDLGVGDVFGARLAGNVVSRKVLASAEYGCAVAGAKLILVMGHTRCGAVTAAVNLFGSPRSPADATGCEHLDFIVSDIQQAISDPAACRTLGELSPPDREAFIDAVARQNVMNAVGRMTRESRTLRELVEANRIAVAGAMYDVTTGAIEFLAPAAGGQQ